MTKWRKASRSQATSNCIELANTLDLVRDSKNVAGPALRGDLRRLLIDVKAGRFDA